MGMLLNFCASFCAFVFLFCIWHMIIPEISFSYNRVIIDQSEYYSCDATYRNWLKIDLENTEVSSPELSNEEKQRAVAAARETLDSSLMLLQSELLHLYCSQISLLSFVCSHVLNQKIVSLALPMIFSNTITGE